MRTEHFFYILMACFGLVGFYWIVTLFTREQIKAFKYWKKYW